MENISKFLFLFFVISIFVVACAKEPVAEKKTPETAAAPVVSGEQAKNILTNLILHKTPTFMVRYDIKGQEALTEMTMYSKNGNMRYDTVSHGNQSSLFLIDNKIYSCSYDPKMCVFFSGETEKPKTGIENVEQNVANETVISKPSRTIAGMTAKCFAVTDGQSSEACYSSDGVLLYVKSESNGNVYEMTATDYSTSVSDSVFALPAEPQDINAMIAKYQQGG